MISKEELIKFMKSIGVPKYRAIQLFYAICNEGKSSYEEISTLPKNLIKKLNQEISILSIKAANESQSKDKKTTKTIFETKDKTKLESVLMKFKDGRNSVCVSSQIGCQLGCKFCATGQMGFQRNLTYEEISDQVLYYVQKLKKNDQNITNVIFMGMGEPFMNYDNVLKAVRLLNDKDGMNIGARSITLSTSGICEGIKKLASENIQVNLAISIHAPNQSLREKIMPIAKKYHLDELMKNIEEYIDKTNRRVTYEYVLLKGINDSIQSAKELAKLIEHQLCHVNLIPYNATGIDKIEGSEKRTIDRFKKILEENKIPVTTRVSLGKDIDAACGQLVNK